MTKITVYKETIERAIAGAVFDFAGYITAHPDTIEVGGTADAVPIVQRIISWAKHSGLSIESADVESWNAVLAEPVVEIGAALAEPAVEPEKLDNTTQLQVAYVMGLRDVSPPPPAEVPLLTDAEIAAALPWVGFNDLIASYSVQQLNTALRAIEQVVHQKARFK